MTCQLVCKMVSCAGWKSSWQDDCLEVVGIFLSICFLYVPGKKMFLTVKLFSFRGQVHPVPSTPPLPLAPSLSPHIHLNPNATCVTNSCWHEQCWPHCQSIVQEVYTECYHCFPQHAQPYSIHYYMDRCYGGQINHPSQKHHKCFTGIPQYFYKSHFDPLMKRLCTNRFLPYISCTLCANGVCGYESRIPGAAETILQLKLVENVWHNW